MGSERQRLGDFEIVREIGRGGMGVVYEAIQLSLNRTVALKVLSLAAAPEGREVERFQREARGAALLDHPRIVPIYAQGEEAGTHYYAMKLVQGHSLNHVIRATREKLEASSAADRRTTLSQQHFRTSARLVMEVAEALEYAHAQGVVHRDIKPHNLILTPEGHLVITDFGLAHFLSAPSMTISGEMVGTPAYMSPEQVRAEQQTIDHRTDIYSLGITLYEMLALNTPFRGETRDALLRQILTKDPPPLRRLNPRIPRDLETICHKAIEKDPSRRYQSARLLVHDLRCFLKGLPITARPIGPVGRLYRHALRRKALTAAVVGAVLALVLGTYFGVQAYRSHQREVQVRRETEVQRLRAEAERQRAEAERDRAEIEAAARLEGKRWDLLTEGRDAIAGGRFADAKACFLEAAKVRYDYAAYLCFWQLRSRFCDEPLATFRGHARGVGSVAFSPDGKVLGSAGADGSVKLWDVATGQELCTSPGQASTVEAVTFDTHGQTLAWGYRDGTIVVRDAATGSQLRAIRTGMEKSFQHVWSLAVGPDGTTLALGTQGSFQLWDTTTGKQLGGMLSGDDASPYVASLAFSPDGSKVASGVSDGSVRLWDVATGRQACTLRGHGGPVWSLAFSPDGKTLASGSSDKAIVLWDAARAQELHVLSGHWDRVVSVAFSPDGKTLASGSWDKTIKLWDVASGKERCTLSGHTEFVVSVGFSADGKTLASGSWDKTIKLWNVTTDRGVQRLSGHHGRVRKVAFNAVGKTLAWASDDDTIRLWDVEAGRELRTLSGHTDRVSSVAFSPDGKTVASGSLDKTIKLWDVATGREIQSLSGHLMAVYTAVFSPDGKTVASAGLGDTIELWDVASGVGQRTLAGHTWQVRSLAFSPDGKTLASPSSDKSVQLWDVATWRELRTLAGHAGVESVAFSPDGRTLASGNYQTVTLWDVASGSELHTLTGHTEWVSSVAFSPDGRTLASGSSDGTARLWDVATGREVVTIGPLGGEVACATFTAGGRKLCYAVGTDILICDIHAYDEDIERWFKEAGVPVPASAAAEALPSSR